MEFYKHLVSIPSWSVISWYPVMIDLSSQDVYMQGRVCFEILF